MANPETQETVAETPFATAERLKQEASALSSSARLMRKEGKDITEILALSEQKEDQWLDMFETFTKATGRAVHAALQKRGLGDGALEIAQNSLWEQSEGYVERATPELIDSIVKGIK